LHAPPGDPYAARVPAPGATISGWTLERELGRGATAIVYAAVRASGPAGIERAALKLPLPGTLDDAAAVARFLRGAEAQRRLTGPGVLPVLDLGTDPHAGPYLVTPLIDGANLADALAAGELPATRALGIRRDVATALDAAAAAGVVHRDVKPSNILLDGDRGLLADFGLARDHEHDPTMTGALAGTLAYLAPELAKGEPPAPTSDRYALACLAYQVLTGSPVFRRPTDAAILYAHVEETPTPPSAIRAELPAAVDAVFTSALAKDPAARPASSLAFVAALEEALGDRTATLGSPATPSAAHAGEETLAPAAPLAAPAPDHAASELPRRGRRTLAAAAGAVGVALTAVALVGIGGGERTEDGPPPPAVGAGLVAIGSDLRGENVIVGRDCDGRTPSGTSPACTISQLALPGRTLTIPEDGLIRAFAVRGVTGPVALQVLRTRDGRTFQLSRSDEIDVPDPAPHRYEVELDAGAGDRLALAVTPRTGLGLREAAGARTERWDRAVGEGSPAGTRAGLDRELLLRGELDPGAVREAPRQLTGRAAAAAPSGREVAASSTRLPDGREVRVALVVVDGSVVIDLSRAGRRRARLELSGLDPAGRPVEFKAFESPGNDSQLNVGWRNPGSTETDARYFGLGAESLEAYS
jgi:serine/threonine-protein kinase